MAISIYDLRFAPQFTIEVALQWISEGELGQPPFEYTGTIINNTESEYDALTWTDARTKPTWVYINNSYAYYDQFFYKTLPINYGLFNTVVQAILDSKLATVDLPTAMAPHISSAVSAAVTTSVASLGISDISGLSTALSGKASTSHSHSQSDIPTLATSLGTKVDKVTGKQLSTEDYSTAEKTKLSGIAPAATANSTDATLLNRANHTGTQAISSVTNLQSSLDSKLINLGSANQAVKTYTGTTDSTGAVVFHITSDSTSTGTALFSSYGAAIPTAFDGSGVAIQAPNAFNVGWSNSSKTLTVRVNRGTSTGVLIGGTVVSEQFAGAGYTVELIVIGTKV